MNDVRPVWLTREQRNLIAVLSHHDPDSGPWVTEILAAWDAAPADPAEAVMDALRSPDLHIDAFWHGEQTTAAVLRALGHPGTPA